MKIIGKYAASNFFLRRGVILDTDKKCFTKSNKIISLFTFYEDCQRLPKLDYILMFRTLYAKCEPCELEDFDTTSMIQLSLVYNKNRRLIVHETRNFQEIKELAKQLSDVFNLRVRDSATDRRSPKWL